MNQRHTVNELWREIQSIKNNHLHHLKDDVDHVKKDVDDLKKDMEKLDKKIEKVDGRFDKLDTKLWWLLGILVTTVVLPSVVAFLQKFPG